VSSDVDTAEGQPSHRPNKEDMSRFETINIEFNTQQQFSNSSFDWFALEDRGV
jgi:hypothetical protein